MTETLAPAVIANTAQADSGSDAPTDAPRAAMGEADATASTAQLRAWATALAGDELRARETASAGLDRAAATAPQRIWALLEDAAPDVRRGAVFYWLDRFDPSDAVAVDALGRRLADPDPTVRAMALSAVQRFPSAAVRHALPALNAALTNRDGSTETRAAAARLIGTLDADGRDAVAALTQVATDDPQPAVRSACLVALCRVATVDQAAPVLQHALQHDAQPTVRGVAAVRLGKLGGAAAGAASALAAALADAEPSVQRRAADALVELGPLAVAPVIARLDATEPTIRRLAVFVLGKLGPAAKPALAPLRERLQDSDAEVKQLAELAIRRIEAGGR